MWCNSRTILRKIKTNKYIFFLLSKCVYSSALHTDSYMCSVWIRIFTSQMIKANTQKCQLKSAPLTLTHTLLKLNPACSLLSKCFEVMITCGCMSDGLPYKRPVEYQQLCADFCVRPRGKGGKTLKEALDVC